MEFIKIALQIAGCGLKGDMSKLKYHKILNTQRLFRDGVSGNGREVFQYFDTSLGGLFLFGEFKWKFMRK